jgi:hypothetical protein
MARAAAMAYAPPFPPSEDSNVRKLFLALGLAAAVSTALPAIAQTAEVLVASGPGVAGAAGTLHLAGKITAINSETREVTLTGEGANQMVVTAGPEVKNFAQLRIGDQVELVIAQALKLELRKGSTAAASRTEQTGRVGSGVEGRPGGAVGRKVVIMAEVTALDAATQTVTLKGPQQSMDLKVADPEQFKGIALGDRVEATYVEAVAMELKRTAAAE